MARLMTVISVAALLFAAGCQAPPTATGPTEIKIDVPDRDGFLDAALSLLRYYDLPPVLVERESGLIVTQRTTSAQWFEPWRVDSQGPYQTLESSLHTISRVVTVRLTPAEPPAADEALAEAPASQPTTAYVLDVQVDKSRYSAPERQITTSSGALAIYQEKVPTTEGLRGARSAQARWVPLGRDPLLEAFLLAKLIDVRPDIDVIE